MCMSVEHTRIQNADTGSLTITPSSGTNSGNCRAIEHGELFAKPWKQGRGTFRQSTRVSIRAAEWLESSSLAASDPDNQKIKRRIANPSTAIADPDF